MKMEDIIIVLCRPGESGNVGAVCRAMKNMGFRRLRIVSPEAPLDDGTIRTRAVHADDVWDRAEHFETLSGAIADCALVVGTTRRRGQHRKGRSLEPRALGSFLSEHPGPAAMVFGNERTGLTGEEVDLCSMVSHIPVNEEFPSLNLSHAVQIYTWELSRALQAHSPLRTEAGRPAGIDRNRLSRLAGTWTDALCLLGFYKQAGRSGQEQFFTEVLARSGLSGQEADYLEKILEKAKRLANRDSKED